MTLKLVPGGIDCILHAMVEGGDPIVFSSIKYGNGPDAGSSASEMSNVVKNIGITDYSRAAGDTFVTLIGAFNNNDINERFRVTETGVFVQDPDDETKEILFAYAHVVEEEAILIPCYTDYAFETTDKVIVYVGAVQNVTAIISQSITAATKAELQEHIEDYTNVHHVTKDQVGLGNVPNVDTDSQAPTIADIGDDPLSDDDMLQNGDTLTTIVSKLARAAHYLLIHIISRSNPHNVTPYQIGAASVNHTHTASQINNGVLPLARGGTGVTSKEQLAALVASGVDAIYKTGIYTGDGSYGVSVPNTISYDKKPKFILVQPVAPSNAKEEGFLCLANVNTLYSGGFGDDVDNKSSELNFTWTDSYVSWYGESALRQNNKNGSLYRYLIVY